MDDGIYIIKRGRDYTLGPQKSALIHAYNDHYRQFYITGSSPAGVFGDPNSNLEIYVYLQGWADWPHYKFVQPDQMTYLLAHWEDGIDIFGFPSPGVTSGTITNVAVCVYMQGRGRPVNWIYYTKYGEQLTKATYGSLTTWRYVYDWNILNMPKNPYTGVSWTWADLASGEFKAGVDLRRAFTSDWSVPNTSSDPWEYYGKDDRLNILGSAVRYIKAIITYIDNGEEKTIELWPNQDISIGTRTRKLKNQKCLVPMIGNILDGSFIESLGDLSVSYNDTYGTDWQSTAYSYAGIRLVNKTAVESGTYKIIINYTTFTNGTNYVVTAYPYIIINGITYYDTTGQALAENATGSYSYNWLINPVTGVEWTANDLDGITEFGLKFKKTSAQGYCNGITLSSMRFRYYKIATGSTEYACTHGPLIFNPVNIWKLTHDYRPAFTAGLTTSIGGLVSRYASDIDVTLPSFSIPGSITVSAEWNCFSSYAAYAKLFIEFNGNRYYASTKAFGNDPTIFQEDVHSWDVSPATGSAWTFEEFSAIRFGIEVSRSNTNHFTLFLLNKLDAQITWQEIAGDTVQYQKLDTCDHPLEAIKYAQTPKIKSNELVFYILPGNFIPERTEMILMCGGKPAFRGLIWTLEEQYSGEIRVTAKSQQVLLENRYMPHFFYYSRNNLFDEAYKINDLFSDDLPFRPYSIHLSRYIMPWPFYYQWWTGEGGQNHLGTTEIIFLAGGVELIQAHECNLGIFFLLNSLPAYGQYESDIIPGIAPIIENRAKFLTNHDPTTNSETDFDEAPDFASHYVSGHGTIFYPDMVGSVRRFQKGVSGSLNLDEYSIIGNDLQLPHYSGAYMPLFDHAFDTHIRPGTNDLGDKILSVPYLFGQKNFADSISDFLVSLGQEPRFRICLQDGNVYMDLATEICKQTNKIYRDIIDNCEVTKTISDDPIPNCVFGCQKVPRLSVNWNQSKCWITKIDTNSTRDGEDLQEWLDLQMPIENAAYSVKIYNSEEWFLETGDKISVQAEDEQVLTEVRVREISISGGNTNLKCGVKIANLDEKFGEWRLKKGSLDTDNLVRKVSFEANGTTCTKSFVVYAADYVDGGWKCRVSISWEVHVDEGYTAVYPLISFAQLKLNGRIVPPGRIMNTNSKPSSGSITIDITGMCNTSESSNITNTIIITIANGLNESHYYHKISGDILQYRRVEGIINA